MRIALLVTAAIIYMCCGMSNIGTEIKGLFHGGQKAEAFHNRKNGRAKSANDMKSMDNGTNLNKSTIRITSSERCCAHALLPNDLSQTRRKRQVLKDSTNPNSTWSNGVFYTFNTSDHIVRRMFKMGAKVWSDATCIDFVEDNNAVDKVVVVEGDCSSSVGRLGGDQCLSLDARTTEGGAVHEIGHVLGFFHTLQRYDRDDYVTIIDHNLDPFYIRQFIKLVESFAVVYGLGYDYGSVMHYGELSGSINQQPTMIARNPFYQRTMGSPLISFSDIFMINEHYGCNAKCNNSESAKCANEGFPHPRNCSICICPGGYGGPFCDGRPSGCGDDLMASREKQAHAYTLGYGLGVRDQFDFCNYMIKAPEGKKIEMDLQSISLGYDNIGCTMGGVEIKAQKDQKLTGYRFCSVNGSGGPIISSYNFLPVILFNRFTYMKVNFTYRYVD